MNRREQILAAAVGGLLVIVIFFFSFHWISRMIRQKKNQVIALEQSIKDKQRIVRFSEADADRMRDYERMSLPSDAEKARSLYQSWLVSLVTEVGFDDPQVNVLASRKDHDVFHEFSFTVNGRADLRQLVNLMYRFYSADFLHRIRLLRAKRLNDTRQLELSLTIDALAMTNADNEDKLNDQPKPVLEYDMIAYMQTILGRNFSGPPNLGPEIEVSGERSGYTNTLISFDVSARDGDRLDSITYGLDGSDLDGVKIDPESGRVEFQAAEPGDYDVVVTATDDGFPPKTVTETVRVSVTDEPEPEPEEPAPPPKPSFDLGKFVFLTGVTETSGRRQAWISVRTEGKLLKLFEGDQFDVGEVTVNIARINGRTVELDSPELEEQWSVSLGQSLEQARSAAAEGI
jgi:hypothetical protein